MLAIKLKSTGRRNQRTFRIIVKEARAKLGGKVVEDLGWYNPHTNEFKINKERIDYWVSKGAQPTNSVRKLADKAENSELGSFKGKEGRKRKKKEKAGGGETGGGVEAPVSEVPQGEVSEVAQEPAPSEAEMPKEAESEKVVEEPKEG